MLSKSLGKSVWYEAPTRSPARLFAAALLHAGSRGLSALAQRLVHIEQRALRVDPIYEFYAESGAPEGALYVDGQLAGRLEGVSRL
jgi:hypothetical protein